MQSPWGRKRVGKKIQKPAASSTKTSALSVGIVHNSGMIMEEQELKEKFITEHSIGTLHPLHSLILDECCETALQVSNDDYATLNTAVSVAFLTCLSGLRSVVEEGLKEYDRVKIVYRGEAFLFTTIEDPAFSNTNFNFFRHEN